MVSFYCLLRTFCDISSLLYFLGVSRDLPQAHSWLSVQYYLVYQHILLHINQQILQGWRNVFLDTLYDTRIFCWLQIFKAFFLLQTLCKARGSLFGEGMRGSRGAAAGGGGVAAGGAAVLVLVRAWHWGASSGAVTDGE